MGLIQKSGTSGVSKSRNGITVSSGFIELGGTNALYRNTQIVQAGFVFGGTDGPVLFSGSTGATPASGAGTRLMWVPAKGALRAGIVSADQWDNANIGTNSFASGSDTKATGFANIALGLNVTSGGNNNQSIGSGFTSNGLYAITIGHYNYNITFPTFNTNHAFIVGFGDGANKVTPDLVVVSYGVGVGNVTAPTALLHLQASDGSAGRGPLKFTAGTLLLAPETGLIEFNNQNLLFAPGDLNRYTFSFVDRIETISAIKTFTASPRFQSGISLCDINAAPLISFPPPVTSAVNYIQVSNAVSGIYPALNCVGSDPNIGLSINSKGIGDVRFLINSSISLLIGYSTINIYKTLSFNPSVNISMSTTGGTKIGTANNQLLGFWNANPIVQPATGGAASVFAANTSGIANDTATWDGYTIGQVVKALRNIGLLA